eukprot:scpid103520/ scgid25421/ 
MMPPFKGVRLTDTGMNIVKYILMISGGWSATVGGLWVNRVRQSTYYRYWMFHKQPNLLKAFYTISTVVSVDYQESDYKRWGINGFTDMPYLPVPDKKTRQRLADDFLNSDSE